MVRHWLSWLTGVVGSLGFVKFESGEARGGPGARSIRRPSHARPAAGSAREQPARANDLRLAASAAEQVVDQLIGQPLPRLLRQALDSAAQISAGERVTDELL